MKLSTFILLVATFMTVACSSQDDSPRDVAEPQSAIRLLAKTSGTLADFRKAIDTILADDFDLAALAEAFDDPRISRPLIAVDHPERYTVGDLTYYLFLVRMRLRGGVDLKDRLPLPPELASPKRAKEWVRQADLDQLRQHQIRFLRWQIDQSHQMEFPGLEELREGKVKLLRQIEDQ